MRSIPRSLPSNTRVFTNCLLSFIMLITPFAPVAAATLNKKAASAPGAKTNGATVPSEAEIGQRLFGANAPVTLPAPPAPLPAGVITATKDDAFPVHPSGKAEPGDTVSYTVQVNNTGGTDATGVTFNDTVDAGTTLVPGSLKVSPLAFADNYSTAQGAALNIAAPGVLANDTGLPAPTAVAIVAGATTGGGTVTLNTDGSFNYTPAPAFTGADTFTYTVTNGQAPNDTATVTIQVDAPPSVTATTPTNGATNQRSDVNIDITFSEPVNVTGSWFTISCTVSGAHTAAVTGGPTTFTLNPNVDFTQGETCTVTVVAAQVADQDTNDPPDNMTADFVSSFSIDAAPTVTTTTPTNGATGVATSDNIIVNFSESVNATTSSFTIECPTGGGALPYTLSASPNTSFTLNPNADLPAGVTCTVTVIAANVTDADTNDPPNNMLANYVFSFTTDAAPSVTATTPTNGATNQRSDVNIDITFSEPVNTNASSFTISCTVSGAHTFAISGGTTTWTLNPSVDFTPGETCTVTVVAAQVTDVDANDPPNNMTANFVFSFSIDAAPSVTTTTPTNGATQQANNTNVTVNFSESVNATTSSFTISCTVSGAHTYTLSSSPSNTFTLNPDTDFTNGETCTVTVVAAQITDDDANDPPDNMAANFVFSFSIDNPPSVTTTVPTNGATMIAPTTNITINFSESVNATTSSFTIECPSGSGNQAFTLSASPSNTFTLDPVSNLPEGVICTVTVIANQITDTDAGDPPDNMTANYVFSFSIPPRAVDDARNATGNIRIVTTGRSNFSVMTNDIGPGIAVTAFDATSVRGGQVSIVGATGTFSYNPPPGYEGTDTFNYTISNAAGSDVGTVTITISGMIWFINNSAAACTTVSAAAGCGRLTNPLSTLASFEAVNGNADVPASNIYNPQANDNIFIYTGAGNYTAPLTLENGQRVIGQGATTALTGAGSLTGITPATDSDTPPSTGGTQPSITSAGNGFNLVSNNQLYGLHFEDTVGTAINSNANVGTLIIGDVTINNDGANGAGIVLDDGGTSFTTTGLNTILARSGIALNVTNTTIGAGGITFRSISSGNADANPDPVNGIILNNTGATAGLTVSANGGTCTSAATCTGGAIQGMTGSGIVLTNTRSPSFDRMFISNTDGSGVDGTQVTNFTFTNSRIDDSGITPAPGVGFQPSNIAFNDQAGGNETNLTGTVTITGNTLSNAYFHGIDIFNFAGTISNANISSNTITSATTAANSQGGGIRVVVRGNAATAATLTMATINGNKINNIPVSVGLQVQCGNASAAGLNANCGTNGSGTNIINITSNEINKPGNGATVKTGSEGMVVLVNGKGQGNFNISSNNIQQNVGQAMTLSAFGIATVTAVINANTIVANNTLASPGIGLGTSSTAGFATTPTLTAEVTNNNISQTDGNGILAVARDGSGFLNIQIKNNTVAAPLTGVRPGIRVDAGNASSTDDAVCLDIEGNTSAGSGGTQGIGLRKQGGISTTNDFGVEGMAATATPGVEAFVNGQNPAGGGTLLISSTTGFSNCSAAPGAMLMPEKGNSDDRAQLDGTENGNGDSALALSIIRGDFASIFERIETATTSASTALAADSDQTAELLSGAYVADELETLNIDAPVIAPKADVVGVDSYDAGVTTVVERGGVSDIAVLSASYSMPDYEDGALIARANTGEQRLAGSKPAFASNDRVVGQSRQQLAHGRKTRKAASTFAAASASATGRMMSPMPSGETVNHTIGTLPAGKGVTITFQVTIDNTFTGTQVSNQGTVTGAILAVPFNVVTDDPATGTADDATVTPVLAKPDISINDGSVAEPASGSANAVFTVVLSHAYSLPISVNFTTATGGANPATAGSDYTTTSGTVTFLAGETIQSISVPVLSDADNSETDETFLVDLSGATDGVVVDSQATGTITVNNPAGTVLISELRTSGPGGAGDDFVEILNATDSDITVPASGWALVKSGATCDNTPVVVAVIPNGTVIPARGNYLLKGSAYSLTAYAAGDQTLSADIEDDRNVALFSTATPQNFQTGTRLDAVGFGLNTSNNCDLLRETSTIPGASGSTSEYSFVRKVDKGETVDTNNSSADFVVVSTTPGTAVGFNTPVLGAPGPEMTTSPRGPVPCNGAGAAKFDRAMLDSTQGANTAPNVVRDPTADVPNNSSFGTIDFRRRFTNNTGGSVTQLRFRIVDMTTSPSPVGTADLRGRTSAQIMVPGVNDTVTCGGATPCIATVEGTSLETPPLQALGGGVNSTLAAGTITLGTPLANGASANLHFLFGVQQVGDYHIGIVLETVTGAGGSLGKDIWELNGNTETSSHTDGSCVFVNAAPVNTVPASPVNKDEDVDLVFTGATKISIADADAGAATVRVSLTSTNGTFSLSGTAGLDFACAGCAGDGTDDSSMIFEGTIANINTALNNLTFKTALNFFSPPNASLTILTDDLGNTGVGGAKTDSDTITITVNGVNDPPSFVIAGNPPAVNEDAGAQTVNGFATSISQGTGDTGQTLTFNVTPAGTTGNIAFSSGPAIDATTGNLTYTTSADTNGTATFNVTLSDNGSNVPPNSNTSGTQQFTITVNAVNDAPTFTKGADPSVDEDAGAQTINNFITNFQPGPAAATDEAGQTLVGYNVSVTGTTGSLSFTSAPAINNAGALTFTAAANTSGTATVSVTATDSGSGVLPNVNTSAAQMFTITVNEVNDPPSFTIAGNPPAVSEDAGAQTVNGFASAISQGVGETGQTLTFNVTAAGTTGNIAFSSAPAIDPTTGNLTYTTSADTNGTATFNVTLSDNGSNVAPNSNTSGTQQFTITVNAVNDAPTFQIPSNPPAVNEDAGAQAVAGFATNFQPGPVTATDEGGQTLVGYTVTLTGTTGNLSFTSGPSIDNTGQLTYTPSNNTSGTATYNVVATDSGSGVAPNVNQSAPVSFTITVNGQNDAPVLDNAGDMTLTAINEDVPNASNPGTLVSAIIASAEPPDRITDNDAGALEGIAVFAVDNTNGTWQFSIDNGTNWTAFGAVDATTARLLAADALTRVRFIPNANFNGTVNPGITFRAWDQTSGTNGNTADVSGGGGGTTAFSTATETASITVNAQNDNPTTIGIPPVVVNEDDPDTVIDLRLFFNDVEDLPAGLVYTVQANTNPGLFTSTAINNANDNLTLDYAPNANGVAMITIRATDTGGLFVDTVLSVTVNSVNDLPTADAQSVSTNEDTPKAITLTGSDLETPSGSLSFIIVTGPANGMLSGSGANRTYTPNADYSGPDSFTFKVNDGTSDSAPATVTITVDPVNDVPTANAQAVSTNEDTPKAITLTGSDKETAAGSLIFTVTVQPTNGLLSGSGANLTYTPNANYNGPDSFKFTVTDTGQGASPAATSAEATVSITVNAVNDTPVAVADSYSTAENTPLVVAQAQGVITNDTDVDNATLTAMLVTGPAHAASFALNANGSFNYTPTAGFSGADSFTYKANDGTADSNTVTVTITVNEGGTLQFSSATYTVNEGAGNAVITITRTGGSAGAAAVQFATSNGTAGASDYTTVTTTVNFADGDTSKTVNVPINSDVIDEPDETVNLTLSGVTGSGSLGAPAAAVLTITDDDATPSISINDVSVTEGNSGTVNAVFTVTLSGQSSQTVTVAFVTANGTATAPSDYTTNAGLVTFNPGETTQQITVVVKGDTPFEADETFFVNLNGANNATIGDNQGQGTILNDDPSGGIFQFSAATYTVSESGGQVTITVNRTGDTALAANVDFATSDDSDPNSMVQCSVVNGVANSRCDFTTAVGTLRFAAGETSKTFVILISQDSFVEGLESLSLSLSNPTNNAVLAAPSTATLSITDDATEAPGNIIDDAQNFVRQHYHDFLNREPDAAGLAFWTDNITKCNDPARRPAGQTVAQCIDKQRESTSSAFFFAPEFQASGGFVYRLYKGSLPGLPNYDMASQGRYPTFVEFIQDSRRVAEGIIVNGQISAAVLEANRAAFAEEFTQRPEFLAEYGGLNNSQYVERLLQVAYLFPTPAERQALVDGLNNHTETRATVLRKVVDGTVFISEGNVQFTTPYGQVFFVRELRRTFVMMEYFGYLRRNPDAPGFNFWLGKLNTFNGDFFQAQMVRSFLVSPEYRARFGTP